MEEKKQVPQIRFKGYVDAWEQRKFGNDLISIQTGTNKLGTEHGKGAPLLKMGNIQRGYFSLEKLEHLFDTEEVEPENIANYGDFFFNTRNTLELVGKGATWTGNSGKYAFNSNIARFKLRDLDTIFFNYLYNTRSMIEQVHARAMGTTSVAAIYPQSLKSIEYYAPTIPEQRQIGEILLKADRLITLHQRKYDKLVNIKKSMLEKMFPKNGSDVPEIRFKGFTDAWKQRKLGEITIYRNGTGHEEKQSESGKYELINLNSISIDGGLKPSGKFIDEETETLLKDDLVMVLSDVGHGDLLGRVAIIPENNRFVLNQRVALLRNNSSVDIQYLFSYINAHQIYFKKQGAGSSQLNISRGSVENFEVLLPHKDEQKKIGNYLSSIDSLITLHQRKLEKLKNIKKSMLDKMFV